MLRAFGKTFGQIRRMSRDFQSTFNQALREAEREASLDEVKKDFADIGKIDPTADLRSSLDETKRKLNEGVSTSAETPAAQPVKAPIADAPPAAAPAEPMDSPVAPEAEPRAAAGGER